MTWFTLTLCSVILGSIANILQKVLMKGDKSNPYSYAIVFHLLLGGMNLLFALWHGFQVPLLSQDIGLLFVSSLLWGGCTIFLFKALQLLESSEVTILSSIKVIITIIASILLLHENFSLQKIIGAIIIFIAILLVSNRQKNIKINIGVLYIVIMAIFSGLGIVVDSYTVQHYDAISYNTITNFIIGFLLLACYPKALTHWKHFIQPNFLKKMLPLGLFSTLQALLYLYSLIGGGNTAQIGTIRQAQVIVTVLLAIIFLNEKSHLVRKLFAAVLVTCGILLLR